MNELDYLDAQLEGQGQMQREGITEQQKQYAPQMREQLAETQAAIITQTNPARSLKIVLEGFKGNISNEDGEWEKMGEPIMNESGIAKVASILIPFVNDAIRFGNISESEVRDIALQTVDDITEEIGINWRDYGIQSAAVRNLIIDSLMALILITLTRSEEQGEKNWLGKVVLESISAGGGQQKRRRESTWEKYFKL